MSRILRIIATLIAVAAATAVLITGLAAGADAARTAVLGTPTTALSVDAQHYRPSVTALEPVPGLSLGVQPDGTLTLVNATGKTVIVLGYAGEPYLRSDQNGVDENLNSLSSGMSTAVSDDPAAQARAGRPPQWQHRDDGTTVIWRDYRTRGPAVRPAVVAADPHHAHQVSTWSLRLTIDGRAVTAQGTVDWVGVPRFSPRQLAMLIAAAVVVLGVAILLIAQLIDLKADRRAELEAAEAEAQRVAELEAFRRSRRRAYTSVG